MKKVKFIITAILAVLLGNVSNAQVHDHAGMPISKTETIKVLGACESCQARIEKAARIDGVKKASWNEETQLLTIIYDATKVNIDEVQMNIANAGHDTEKYKADDKVYDSLPGCCKYERL